MKSIWILIFIAWIIWKVVKPAIEEAQRRSQKPPAQPPQRQKRFAQGRPHGHEPPPAPGSPQRQEPFAQGRPHGHEPPRGQASMPGRQSRGYKGDRPASTADAMSDMERLFAEAMERKRGIGQAPARGRPQVARPRPVQQRPAPEPEREEWIPAAPEPEADPWIPPQPEPRREVKVERTDVVRSRKREVVKPAAEPPKPPPAPAGVRKRTKPRRRMVQRKPACTIPVIGTLNMNDVRKGIVIAEILGPPKGLGDIDSHVI